jgi:isocitrate lyase
MSKHDIALLEKVKVLEKDWNENPRWKDIKRGYAATDVVRLRGTVEIEHMAIDQY